MKFDYPADILQRYVAEVKYAEKAADIMISRGMVAVPVAGSVRASAGDSTVA